MSKKMLFAFVVAILLSFSSSIALAADDYADYPNKPITLVLPFGAGGSHDAHARLMERIAPKYLGQPLIVELKPGGGGAVGATYGAQAAPDGYTLTFGSNGPTTIVPLMEDLPYNRDSFVPVFLLNKSSSMVVTGKDGWKTVQELIEDAKQNPGKYSFATGGMFNSGHMCMEIFQRSAGIQLNNVTMSGSEPEMAVLGGQVELCGAFASDIVDLTKDGSLVPLVVSSMTRLPQYPDVPCFADLGYDMEWSMWRGVLAPAGTPQEIVEKLDQAFKKMCEDPEFIELLARMDESVGYMNHTDFGQFWDTETEYFKNLLTETETK